MNAERTGVDYCKCRIVEKIIPSNDSTVNIPPHAIGLTTERNEDEFIIRYLSPLDTDVNLDEVLYSIDEHELPIIEYSLFNRTIPKKHEYIWIPKGVFSININSCDDMYDITFTIPPFKKIKLQLGESE